MNKINFRRVIERDEIQKNNKRISNLSIKPKLELKNVNISDQNNIQSLKNQVKSNNICIKELANILNQSQNEKETNDEYTDRVMKLLQSNNGRVYSQTLEKLKILNQQIIMQKLPPKLREFRSKLQEDSTKIIEMLKQTNNEEYARNQIFNALLENSESYTAIQNENIINLNSSLQKRINYLDSENKKLNERNKDLEKRNDVLEDCLSNHLGNSSQQMQRKDEDQDMQNRDLF